MKKFFLRFVSILFLLFSIQNSNAMHTMHSRQPIPTALWHRIASMPRSLFNLITTKTKQLVTKGNMVKVGVAAIVGYGLFRLAQQLFKAKPREASRQVDRTPEAIYLPPQQELRTRYMPVAADQAPAQQVPVATRQGCTPAPIQPVRTPVNPFWVPGPGEQVAYSQNPPQAGWYAIRDAVLFDREHEPAFAFTNFYDDPGHPFRIQNYYYPTLVEQWRATENYFQAMKTSNPIIRCSYSQMRPDEVLKHVRTDITTLPQDWDVRVRYAVMRMALNAKFAKQTRFASILLATKGRVLVEKTFGRTRPETHWGAHDGFGGNHLGRMLMVIRDSLEESGNSERYDYNPATSYTLENVKKIRPGWPLKAARDNSPLWV